MKKISALIAVLTLAGCAGTMMKPGWRELQIEGTRVFVDPVNPPEYTAYGGGKAYEQTDPFVQQRRQIEAVEQYTGCKVVKSMWPPEAHGARILHAIVDCSQTPLSYQAQH